MSCIFGPSLQPSISVTKLTQGVALGWDRTRSQRCRVSDATGLLGCGVDRDGGDVVDPAGGFDVGVVDEFELAGGGEGLAGAGDGYDDFRGVEAGLNFGEGVEDPVSVGPGGDDVLVEHGVLGFFGEGDAGFREDVGE